MTYFADLKPFTIRDHNEEVLGEVSRLRLEKRLRESRRPRSGRRLVPSLSRMPPLPR